MITLNNINLSSIDLSGIDLRGIKLGLGGRGSGSGDGFPQLPGDVTRWHFGGLTNEMMAAMDDPRIEDADHKGRFLSFKNFAWKGMSGVGGYAGDFSKWANNRDTTEIGITKSNSKVIIDVKVSQGSGKNIVFISKSNLGISNNVTIKITSTYPEGVMKFANSASNKYLKLPSNGIITLQDNPEYTSNEMHFHLASADLGQITIEQLPLYPGALVFDGVDDYGICDNFPVLTKEKGYTVVALRQYLFNATDKIRSLVTNAPSSIVSRSTLTFELIGSNGEKMNFSFGRGNLVSDFEPNVFSYMTSKSYNGKTITPGDVTESNKRILVGNFSENGKYGSNVAIWELVYLDHDATEEELTKIKDYFVKTYPWLFPDQAWTVTGKTNEDEDRATIANITGNGNDLVLSNFGFAEGSGYGLYKLNFNNWFANSGSGNVNIVNVVNPHKIVLEQSQEAVGAFFLGKNVSYSGELKISVSNKPSDIELSFGSSALGRVILNEGINIVKINPVNTSIGFFTNKAFEAQNIIIEQIPDYEGYLVTDGVDDIIVSKEKFATWQYFTIVGDWQFIIKEDKNSGVIIHGKLYCYNRVNGIWLYVNDSSVYNNLENVIKIRALSSDGKVYDENWNEIQIKTGGTENSNEPIQIAGHSQQSKYTRIAFKNIAIYNSLLSKEDCIKAYNYLQTLKAK